MSVQGRRSDLRDLHLRWWTGGEMKRTQSSQNQLWPPKNGASWWWGTKQSKCTGAVANSMGKLRGLLCAGNMERPTWSPQGRWQGLINTFPLQDVPWPVKNHLCSKSHSSFKLTGRKGAGCWYRVPVASRVLRISCSSLNSPGCVLRGFFLYFISQV